MAGYPARVGRAPKNIVFFDIKYYLSCIVRVNAVAADGMDNTFRLAGRAGSVKHKQRIFGVHDFRGADIALVF